MEPPGTSMVSSGPSSTTLGKPSARSIRLQGRIRQEAAPAAGHDDGADALAQLQQRLEHQVIRVAVGDERVVDALRQIRQGVARLIAGHG